MDGDWSRYYVVKGDMISKDKIIDLGPTFDMANQRNETRYVAIL